MHSIVRSCRAIGLVLIVFFVMPARVSLAQQVQGVIGSYYPTQLIPGQTTVLHVALGRYNPVQSIEIIPSTGLTVTETKSRDLNQGSIWWEFTIAVAKDAAPGPRTLVAVQQNG